MEVDEPSKAEADTAATETAKPAPVLVRLDASLLLWLSFFSLEWGCSWLGQNSPDLRKASLPD